MTNTSLMALATVSPTLGDSHQRLLSLFNGRTLTAPEAQAETEIAAHKRFPEMVKKGLIRKVAIDGVVQVRGTPKATVYERAI